ncbi:hypothetical protein [Flexibacterium corallicola]|uniref:hypothetical protein n=1 Tax=Flexibacterium corallicola TaxID=3037259 RepID=UPI00286EFC8B|nr:hypothetical protein [Pseudovibrio sp. M1P-2-3]
MVERFTLLLKHYDSDIARLEGIIESGNLIAALSNDRCPVCGASSENHVKDHICEGDINEVTLAAEAEKVKVKVCLLRKELASTLEQISQEESHLNIRIDYQRALLDSCTQKLNMIQPDLMASRENYSELVGKKAEVLRALGLFDSLRELENKIAENTETGIQEQETTENRVPEVVLDELAQQIAAFLEDWKLPNSERVRFSRETNDLVINGKHRRSNGKGHRSITHAAVTLGLSTFLKSENLPYPGFIVLDSPLIAYEEPDEVDEVSHTDLNKNFFNCLMRCSGIQTIIFENKKSVPSNIGDYGNVTQFTKNDEMGRYGFFPT